MSGVGRNWEAIIEEEAEGGGGGDLGLAGGFGGVSQPWRRRQRITLLYSYYENNDGGEWCGVVRFWRGFGLKEQRPRYLISKACGRNGATPSLGFSDFSWQTLHKCFDHLALKNLCTKSSQITILIISNLSFLFPSYSSLRVNYFCDHFITNLLILHYLFVFINHMIGITPEKSLLTVVSFFFLL